MRNGDAPPPLFRQRNFLALWSGQLISLCGDRLNYLGLVGLLLRHTSNFKDPRASLLLPILAYVMLAPVLVLSPFTGVGVDRWNLRRVLIVSDLLRAGIVWVLPALYLAFHHTLPVFVLVFLLFTCNVFFLPAKSAITPEIVPHSQLLAANALLTLAGVIATAATGLGGGWVVDHWGWPTALRIDALTYLVSVVTLAVIRYRPSPKLEAPPAMTWGRYFGEMREGWSMVRHNPTVGLGLTALAAVWIGGGFLHVAGNEHIQIHASKAGMERVGLLQCLLGLGAGLGTWVVNRWGKHWPRPLLLGAALIGAAGGLVAFAVSHRFAVFGIAAFLVGLLAAPTFVLSETLIQEGTELQQRGRIFSLRDFLMRLVFLAGVLMAGFITRAFGTWAALLAAALCIAAIGALTVAWGRDGGGPGAAAG